jgi:DivIVA domain-containing protein
MAMDRDDVVRKDFPVVRKGYDPTTVDAHLRKVAAGVEELAKAPPPAPPRDTAGSAAAGKVQAIVEAAEKSAEEIERQAREDADGAREQAATEAREHVDRVSAAADEMRGRIDELERTLAELVTRLRADAEGVATDLESLRAHVGVVRSGEEPAAPAPAVPAPAPAPPPARGRDEVEALEDEIADSDALVAEMETAVGDAGDAGDDDERRLAAIKAAIAQESAAADAAAPAGDDDAEPEPVEEADVVDEEPAKPDAPDEDIEGARLAALSLAMKGESREEITRRLAGYHLSDPGTLVDDVIAKVGR